MYNQILAALDGSPRTDLVLRHAAALAATHGAALHLCRAVNIPLGMPVEAWSLSGEELTARLVELAHQDLQSLRGTLTTPLAGEIHVRLGRPAQVICDVADAIAADLIIIGSHGFEGLDRLLGTTAARVVNHAACSVLVVRPPRDTAA
jgi:nucleotide-binding universal stress UspA family protein